MTTLLADIGGTNARFSLLDGERYTPPANLPLDGHPGIAAAIAAFLGTGPRPDAAVLAVAGPVRHDRVTLTNRGWTVDGAEIAALLGLGRVRVVNDFAAVSWSLPQLAGDDLVPLGGGAAETGEPRAVLGAGTGLGVGAFLPPDRVLVTEGGHASLAAHDAREAAVVEWLRARHGHVSAERLISGQGIENIHAALSALDGAGTAPLDAATGIAPLDAATRIAPLDAATVTARALSGECRLCREALEMFCALLGGVAGDLALLYGARGGVYVGGGICPRFPEFLAASRFRARFEAKGRFRAWLAPVPAWLIMRPDAAMLGLAALARQR